MSRAKRTELIEKISQRLNPASALVDMGLQFEVWRCTCGKPHETWPKSVAHEHKPEPAEVLPEIYGGTYNRILRRYVAPSAAPRKVACHDGQVEILTLNTEGLLRVLALGSPGAGKTFCAVRRALRMALDRPNTTGGL